MGHLGKRMVSIFFSLLQILTVPCKFCIRPHTGQEDEDESFLLFFDKSQRYQFISLYVFRVLVYGICGILGVTRTRKFSPI